MNILANRRLTLLLPVILSGCVLEPTAVRLNLEHTSHISQHFEPQNFDAGYNALMLDVHWQVDRFHLDIADGINLQPKDSTVIQAYGGLAGPREVFQATLGVDLWKR